MLQLVEVPASPDVAAWETGLLTAERNKLEVFDLALAKRVCDAERRWGSQANGCTNNLLQAYLPSLPRRPWRFSFQDPLQLAQGDAEMLSVGQRVVVGVARLLSLRFVSGPQWLIVAPSVISMLDHPHANGLLTMIGDQAPGLVSVGVAPHRFQALRRRAEAAGWQR